MRAAAMTRSVFHRARTVAPQRPFERPASDFVCIATWPPRCGQSTPFHPRRPLRAFWSRAPVHAPRCQREARFSEPRRCLPTSATFLSTRGHTRRAFDPRTRVGLSPRYSPAPTDAGCVGLHDALPHRGPASHSPFAPACARRVPLAWTGQTVGRGARAKANARSWTIRACPSRSASSTRVAGSTRREVWSPSRLVAPA